MKNKKVDRRKGTRVGREDKRRYAKFLSYYFVLDFNKTEF